MRMSPMQDAARDFVPRGKGAVRKEKFAQGSPNLPTRCARSAEAHTHSARESAPRSWGDGELVQEGLSW